MHAPKKKLNKIIKNSFSIHKYNIFKQSFKYLQVEHGLLPVGVLVGGSGAERHPLVALWEVHAEEADEAVHEIVPLAGELEGGLEVHVLHLHRVQVHFLDEGGVGAHLCCCIGCLIMSMFLKGVYE